MSLIDDFLNNMYDDWGDKPQSKICSILYNYFLEQPAASLNHIAFGDLKNCVDKAYTEVALLQCIQYLCGDRCPALNVNFELIEDKAKSLALSYAEVNGLHKNGFLVNPESGEIVENFEEKVFIYFTLSDFMKGIKWH